MKVTVLFVAVVSVMTACSDPPLDTIEQLEDPGTCMTCHPTHYDQWSGSMHAYASDDPVFLAMNKRGQREAQLGTFCVQCHAPMAVALGLTDGTDFDPTTLPPAARGITCYFCHDVESIQADHNNGLVLALDQTMRGGAANPVHTPAHDSLNDPMMATATNNSTMCGSCHDVITPAPNNVPIERTYTEWQASLFANNDPMHHLPLTCTGCHMISSTNVIADKPGLDVPLRTNGFHEHVWPGIDQALTPFPNTDVMAMDIARDLAPAVTIISPTPITGPPIPGGICLNPDGTLTVRMVSIGPGHSWPTGAAQDRRAWLEVQAFDASNNLMLDTSVPAGQDPDDPDPQLASGGDRFWDRTYKSDGTPAHFFWDVAAENTQLPAMVPPTLKVAITLMGDHSTTATFNIANFSMVDHITTKMRILPYSYGVLNDLVSSGDLDPSFVAMDQPLDIEGTERTWTRATMGTGSALDTPCNPD